MSLIALWKNPHISPSLPQVSEAKSGPFVETLPLPQPSPGGWGAEGPLPWAVGQSLWTPEIEYPNGAARPHPVSLNVSNGFRWGEGLPGRGMGRQEAAHAVTPSSPMALHTSSQPGERGLGARSERWLGGAFPGAPPPKGHMPPKAGKWQGEGMPSGPPPRVPVQQLGRELTSWLYTDTGPHSSGELPPRPR